MLFPMGGWLCLRKRKDCQDWRKIDLPFTFKWIQLSDYSKY